MNDCHVMGMTSELPNSKRLIKVFIFGNIQGISQVFHGFQFHYNCVNKFSYFLNVSVSFLRLYSILDAHNRMHHIAHSLPPPVQIQTHSIDCPLIFSSTTYMAQTHGIPILRDDALSLTASNRAYHQTPPMQSFSPLKTSFIPCIVVAVELPYLR